MAKFDTAGNQLVALGDVTGAQQKLYIDPIGEGVPQNTSLRTYISDDFGGSVLDPLKWDVYDGGLGAVTQSGLYGIPPGGSGVTAQGAIGTGVTGITHAVAGSGLTVTMGVVPSAEHWILSKQMLCGNEDILVILSQSQPLAANSIFIGLVEVDPTTGFPLLNQNAANEFTNRGGIDFGKSAVSTAAQLEGIADSSSTLTTTVNGATFAPAAKTTTFETLLQIRAEDMHAQSAVIDTAAPKTANTLRLSSQVPNDTKVYKLLMRFRNIGTPASSTTVVIARILVMDNQTQAVQITEASGAQNGSQGLPVNVNTLPALPPGSNGIGYIALTPSPGSIGPLTPFKLLAAATTNATSLKTSIGRLYGGQAINLTTSDRFLKFYNKASAPTVGTDVPIWTVVLPGNAVAGNAESINLAEIISTYGLAFSTGIAFAITGGIADSDTTACSAGDVMLNLNYV